MYYVVYLFIELKHFAESAAIFGGASMRILIHQEFQDEYTLECSIQFFFLFNNFPGKNNEPISSFHRYEMEKRWFIPLKIFFSELIYKHSSP